MKFKMLFRPKSDYKKLMTVGLAAIALIGLIALLNYRSRQADQPSAQAYNFVEDFATRSRNRVESTDAGWDTKRRLLRLAHDSSQGFIGHGGRSFDLIAASSSDVTDLGLPDIAIDRVGNQYAVWQARNQVRGNSEIYFAHFDGSNWVGMASTAPDNISLSPDASQAPAIAVSADGVPYIAWLEAGADIMLSHWDGSSWLTEVIASSILVSGDRPRPSLGLDSLNMPYLAWHSVLVRDQDGDFGEVSLTHWDGAAWVNMAGQPGREIIATGRSIDSVDLRLNADDEPYLGWEMRDGSDANRIFFTRWDRSTSRWAMMNLEPGQEAVSPASLGAWHGKMAIDSQGRPFIAYSDDTVLGRSQAAVRWDSSRQKWARLDGGEGRDVFGTGDWASPFINSDGEPCFTYNDKVLTGIAQTFFTCWNGKAWTDGFDRPGVLNVSNDSSGSSDSETAIDKTGNVYVIYQGDSGGSIRLVRKVEPDIYHATGTVRSTAINDLSLGRPVASAIVRPVQELNAGVIEYYLSNNGGRDWVAAPLGQRVVFETVDSDLRWRADLASADAGASPLIRSINIDYALADR